ncbi:Protein HIR1 [Zancudomyces culisetae]|uniref:Protein HIR1 n=1 Tax=Zancudomyces culisetae TaxID=1213189 RepID=A0A1R1PMN7_ZANCU|nr:Protein HIR1 [Zancudomyces culisetae]|eukprot:OMH82218.1 Protein HIR1 [Zancudomyces culisetae]
MFFCVDNKIRVWDIETILDAENIHDNEKKKPLSVLTSHVGAVLCVRFCHGKGNKIVSGADDMSVLIWEKDE